MASVLGNLDLTNVAIIFGLFYFVHFAVCKSKKSQKKKERDEADYQRDKPDLDHMDPSTAPGVRPPLDPVRL